MKFFFLISICFFTSFSCFAKWKKVIENKNFSEFVETNNVKKKNGIIYLWTLKNFVTEQKDLERSLKFYSRYDCKKIKYEVLSIISYKTQMGRGRDFYYKKNIKDYSDNSNWIYPKVDGEAYKLMKIICNLK